MFYFSRRMQIFAKTGEPKGWVGRDLSQFIGKSDCGQDQGVVKATEKQRQQEQEQQTQRRCPAPRQSRTQGLAYVVRAKPSL